MYSSILASIGTRGSEGERNSIKKSGHRGRNLCFCSTVKFASRSRLTQEASGERIAPLGRTKPVEESKPTPLLSCLAHTPTSVVSSKVRLPVSPPVGGMISRSPSALRSMRHSRFSWQNSKNCSSSISSAGRVCSTTGWYSVLTFIFVSVMRTSETSSRGQYTFVRGYSEPEKQGRRSGPAYSTVAALLLGMGSALAVGLPEVTDWNGELVACGRTTRYLEAIGGAAYSRTAPPNAHYYVRCHRPS